MQQHGSNRRAEQHPLKFWSQGKILLQPSQKCMDSKNGDGYEECKWNSLLHKEFLIFGGCFYSSISVGKTFKKKKRHVVALTILEKKDVQKWKWNWKAEKGYFDIWNLIFWYFEICFEDLKNKAKKCHFQSGTKKSFNPWVNYFPSFLSFQPLLSTVCHCFGQTIQIILLNCHVLIISLQCLLSVAR